MWWLISCGSAQCARITDEELLAGKISDQFTSRSSAVSDSRSSAVSDSDSDPKEIMIEIELNFWLLLDVDQPPASSIYFKLVDFVVTPSDYDW